MASRSLLRNSLLPWELSKSLDVFFWISALQRALSFGKPEIFNSDKGSQFTSEAFTSRLKAADIAISWDGRGRVFDNIFVERLWRSIQKFISMSISRYKTPGKGLVDISTSITKSGFIKPLVTKPLSNFILT